MATKVQDKRVRRDSPQAQMALRNAAVETALSIYQKQGLPGLTMRAVAEQVGVTPMALYRYFTNKAELLSVIGEVAIGELVTKIREAIASATTARARILASTLAFVTYWEEHPDHYRLVFIEAQPDSPLNAPRLANTMVYQQMIELSNAQFNAFADELGTHRRHVTLARDLRLTLMLGYLQASMVNTRYPWHDKAALRACVVEVAVNSAADCLRGA